MDRSLVSVADYYFSLGRGFYEDGSFETARKYLAASLGVNRSLERINEMEKCRKLLELTGLDQREIEEYQNKGFDILVWALEAYSMIKESEANGR